MLSQSWRTSKIPDVYAFVYFNGGSKRIYKECHYLTKLFVVDSFLLFSSNVNVCEYETDFKLKCRLF